MRRVVLVLLAAVVGISAGCTAGPADPHAATSTTSATLSSVSTTPITTPSRTTTDPPSPSRPLPPVTPASPMPATSSGDPAASGTGFTSSIAPIDPDLAARMAPSWRAGCPVPLADLRYLTLAYRDFDGADHTGEMVVAASVADDVVAVFHTLYDVGYPIASMRLVDDFGGDDDASMSANNTSAFNCRAVTGGSGFSEHSLGTAIDVNPVQNPYLAGSTVLPADGLRYLDRPDSPGVIHAGDEVVRAFAEHSFSWGGNWRGPIDYQHFSVSGR